MAILIKFSKLNIQEAEILIDNGMHIIRQGHLMPRISLKEIEKGMVLSGDVTSNNGNVLLKAGVELTDKHIKILKTWGVTHIEIEGEDSSTPLHEIIAAHPEYLEEANDAAKTLFRNTNIEHPFFVELIELWSQHYVKNKALRDED